MLLRSHVDKTLPAVTRKCGNCAFSVRFCTLVGRGGLRPFLESQFPIIPIFPNFAVSLFSDAVKADSAEEMQDVYFQYDEKE